MKNITGIRPSMGFVLVLFTILSLCACSRYNKLLKSDDVGLKYEAAMEYYESQHYPKTVAMLEVTLPHLRGDKRAEKATFIFGKSHFLMKRYIEAASYLKTFLDTYSRSPYSEEALYLATKSLYLQSSSTELDQSSTETAYEASHTFLNKYPSSSYANEVEAMSTDARTRLETKDYNNAKLYYKLKKYNPNMLLSAIVSVENFEIDHPESVMVEELRYMKLKARYDLANLSTAKKRYDRLKKTEEDYLFFIEEYTKGDYVKGAEKIYKKVLRDLDNIQHKNKITIP